MKLIIQIPCLNEAETLPATLADLPRQVPGIDLIEVLVIDDGSRDATSAVARAHGVDHIVRLRRTRGSRPRSPPASTPVSNRAPTSSSTPTPTTSTRARHPPADRAAAGGPRRHRHRRSEYPATLPTCRGGKRLLQRLGSWVVRAVSNTNVPDTTSGFRAYTRDAALRMTIVSEFWYTLESIIQAGRKRMAVVHVEISTNPHTRESRLFERLFVHQAVGRDHRPGSTRCTNRSRSLPTSAER